MSARPGWLARVDRARVAEVGLWVATASVLLLALQGTRWAPSAEPAGGRVRALPPLAAARDPQRLARERDRVVARDPFRLKRHASPLAFTIAAPEQPMGAPMPGMRPAKPALVLRGLIGGPPWEAIVDGVPGRGRAIVVKAGDVLGSPTVPGQLPQAGATTRNTLHVRYVSATGVVITGMDTTWRLSVGGRP